MQYNSLVELDKEQHCAPNNTVLMGVKADLPDKGTLRICRYCSNVMLGGPSSVLAYRVPKGVQGTHGWSLFNRSLWGVSWLRLSGLLLHPVHEARIKYLPPRKDRSRPGQYSILLW
jgi:hypothetical protein